MLIVSWPWALFGWIFLIRGPFIYDDHTKSMHTFCLKMFLNHVLLLLVIQLTSCKIPHVKIYIWKLFNSQSYALPPNVSRSLCLNTHKQPSPSSAQKPFHCATKLSYLKLHRLAHLNCVMIVVLMLILESNLLCKSNHLW